MRAGTRLTLSRSCVVNASLLTRPMRSMSSARVTRIRFRAMGVGNDRSRTEKNLWVLKGGLICTGGEAGVCGRDRPFCGSIGGWTNCAGTDASEGGGAALSLAVAVSSTEDASVGGGELVLGDGSGGGFGGGVNEEPWAGADWLDGSFGCASSIREGSPGFGGSDMVT